MTNNTIKIFFTVGIFLLSNVQATFAYATAELKQSFENFVLLDQLGNAHEMHYHKQAVSIVLVAQSNSCSLNNELATAYSGLQDKYRDANVKFFMLNSNNQDDRTSIDAFAKAQNLNTTILNDDSQLIGEALNISQAGETLVVDPSTWTIQFKGSLENSSTAIDRLLASSTNNNAIVPETEELPNTGADCKIEFANSTAAARQQHKQISYSNDIAPLLQDKCVVCHTEGGLGPWAMTDYNMVLGFSPMIREVLRTKRMPPWHADPHIGVWKNDISLNTEQLQTLVHWIEAGSPRGTGPDPLAQTKLAQVEWPLGEPDLIIDIPAHTVPATGVVDYQFPTVANPLKKGVWVKAAAVVPGDREVVHHILAGTQDSDTTELRRTSGVFDNYLLGYAPGNESHTFPKGTGVYIPAGGEFLFQLHYTPVGRETVDKSRIGLYFHSEVPENFFRQDVVVNPTIKIPPNAARHAEVAYYAFDKEAVLHDLVPHAHYRGIASRFELEKPDGSKEIILNVPNYDFNWQRTYEFVEPKKIEAGSRLIHTTWYDNSTANTKNPDAEREVPWGLQSWDEMLYGAFSYTYVNESTEAPIHDKQRARTTQFVGFLDKNIDGKLSWRELPKQIKKQLVQGFKAVDSNGDGGLDIEEMHKITLMRQEAREKREAEEANDEQSAPNAR